MAQKIMIVDDDEDIREVVSVLLESEGYQVICAECAQKSVEQLEEYPQIDLIVLDIMLPDQSGFSICKILREKTMAPILFLSAKSKIQDKEMALSLGGDDYITKPFSPLELLAHVKALLRRYSVYQGKDYNNLSCHIVVGELSIHKQNGKVFCAGEEVFLRYREYQLLLFMAMNKGRVFSAKQIYEAVWKERFLPSANNNVVTHIKNLRRKIERDSKNPEHILTVWGRGYKLV